MARLRLPLAPREVNLVPVALALRGAGDLAGLQRVDGGAADEDRAEGGVRRRRHREALPLGGGDARRRPGSEKRCADAGADDESGGHGADATQRTKVRELWAELQQVHAGLSSSRRSVRDVRVGRGNGSPADAIRAGAGVPAESTPTPPGMDRPGQPPPTWVIDPVRAPCSGGGRPRGRPPQKNDPCPPLARSRS